MTKQFEDNKRQAFLEYLENSNAQEVEFDLWARDVNDFKFLQERIPDIVVTSAGGLCPFQVEGMVQDYYFYLKARGGVTTLKISDSEERVYLEPHWSSTIERETSFYDLEDNLVELFHLLTKANFCYKFEGHEIDFNTKQVDKNTVRTVWSRGYSSEEAWNNIFVHYSSDLLLEKLQLTKTRWVELLKECEFNKTPSNQDLRVFPETQPVFLV